MNCPLDTRLLIAEDEPMLSTALTRVLTAEGHQVTVAKNGEEAMRLLEEDSFDAVISDISMPELDGIELLICLNEQSPDIPVILMTGMPTLETAMKGIEFHAFHYLPKPFNLDKFCSLVMRAVNHGTTVGKTRLTRQFDRFLETCWMAFQPILNQRGSVYGYEALMRSREPSLPHPGAVLDAAVSLERLTELGRVLRERAMLDFAAHAPPSADLFVNLHPKELLDDALYDADAPLSRNADRIILEITERLALRHIPEFKERVRCLRDLGFRIAVDDLGFGYASLTSIVELEPEIVKLDMGLVRDIDQSPPRQNIVRSVLSMRHALDFAVVAEGVETAAERDSLVALGCDLYQGYLLGRPGAAMPDAVWP